MAYYIDDEKIRLDDLQRRIEETDLVPSRSALLDDIGSKFETLKQHGIVTFAKLRHELKNAKRLEALAAETGIGADYLTLLRREIESYFPKASKLKEFDWMPEEEIDSLEEKGIKDTAKLYEAAQAVPDINDLAESTGTDAGFLEALVRMADLTRVQWVSPTAARMLMAVSCDSAAKLAAADAEELCRSLEEVNKRDNYFKGNIGLRDIKRLVKSAGYVK